MFDCVEKAVGLIFGPKIAEKAVAGLGNGDLVRTAAVINRLESMGIVSSVVGCEIPPLTSFNSADTQDLKRALMGVVGAITMPNALYTSEEKPCGVLLRGNISQQLLETGGVNIDNKGVGVVFGHITSMPVTDGHLEFLSDEHAQDIMFTTALIIKNGGDAFVVQTPNMFK